MTRIVRMVVIRFVPFVMGFVLGCPVDVEDGPKVSDVPCFVPETWVTRGSLRVRLEDGDLPLSLLLTQQTLEQRIEDNADGRQDFSPHDAVYRFNPELGSFELTCDGAWDQSHSNVATGDSPVSESPFAIPGNSGRPPLLYDGRAVPVVGGTAVLAIRGVLEAGEGMVPVAAVVSATGTRAAPFVSSGQASGQHYHQLFSEELGAPIGEALRIGVGGREVGPVKARWGSNSPFIVYYDTDVEDLFDMICVVDARMTTIPEAKKRP